MCTTAVLFNTDKNEREDAVCSGYIFYTNLIKILKLHCKDSNFSHVLIIGLCIII